MSLSPSRWQQIAAIYERAIDQDGNGRDAFLAHACAGDEALRRDVESLLEQDAEPAIVDRSVCDAAASLFDDDDLTPGTALGPYRIDGPLGTGGMARVYRATDTRLNRPVALKVLPPGLAQEPQMRARFAREARAIAAFAHPHICTLHDVGHQDGIDFLVMECLEGQTLAARLTAGPLPLEEAVTRAIEIASALEHAHAHDIVHRDLKPANIMLTAAGAKLLDFGISKSLLVIGESSTAAALGAAEGDGDQGPDTHGEDRRDLTRDGTVVGTLRYMAPEQLKGQAPGARSDLFSFGAVLFEMLTGNRAFSGTTPAEVRQSVLEREPPAICSRGPAIWRRLDEIVQRCLAKDPGERWQSATDLSHALKDVADSMSGSRSWAALNAAIQSLGPAWLVTVGLAVAVGTTMWFTTGRGPGSVAEMAPGLIQSIAVLPLDNPTEGGEQESIADTLNEQLIADLATVEGLRVISRTSVVPYKNHRKPVPIVARELRVDAVITGTVLEAPPVVRVTLEMVSGTTGEVLWRYHSERDVNDGATLHLDVAQSLIAKVGRPGDARLNLRPAGPRPAERAEPRDVLLARYHAAKGTEEGLRKAVTFFTRAIASEPLNAAAHAGLAKTYTELSGFYMDPRLAMPKAREAALTAIGLDDTLAEAHAALGYVALVYDWDGHEAARALARALELNPTLATARLNYAAYLTTQARPDEAVREILRAVDLDPLSVRTHAYGAMLLLFTRRYDEALELTARALELDASSGFTLAVRGVGYAAQGRFEEAVDTMQRATTLDDSLTVLALQAHVLAAAGRTAQALSVVRQVEAAARRRYFCPYEIGTVYVSLGDFDTAAALFRKGTTEHADCMAWLGVEPWIETFRTDPRYPKLLRDIGLSPPSR